MCCNIKYNCVLGSLVSNIKDNVKCLMGLLYSAYDILEARKPKFSFNVIKGGW